MRFELYIYIVAAALILGWLMPQEGSKRKYYIILMAMLHIFMCAFRYNHLTGDLIKYNNEFVTVAGCDWFSEQVFHEGRNFGFYMFLKLVYHMTGGDFQMVLIIIAVFCEYALALLVYRYSPKPWLSYLIWNCLGFFVFGFNAIKQAFAMGFVMLSVIGILERRPKFFSAMMFLAGCIHVPALAFLPAYWLSKKKVDYRTIAMYLLAGVLIFVFKNQILAFIKSFYYEDEEVFMYSGDLGGRFLMVLLIALCGLLLKGFRNADFEALFHFMAASTILQMFASFDNIFTRLTDYYFQMSVLYIPMLFYHTGGPVQHDRPRAIFCFNARSLRLICAVVSLVLLLFYWVCVLNSGKLSYTVDDYLNFRFMWDVK